MRPSHSVSVRIRHPHADPAVLSRHLGVQPEHSWKAGDPRPGAPDGSADSYRETYWFAELSAFMLTPLIDDLLTEPVTGGTAGSLLELDLAAAMRQFERCPAYWQQFIAEGGSAEFIVELYGRTDFSLDLSYATVAKMARLGLALSVSFHAQLQAVA